MAAAAAERGEATLPQLQRQPEAPFAARRGATLHALAHGEDDRSPKGSVDAPIAALIAWVNTLARFFTTSSCSGRIALFERAGAGKGGRWLLAEHAQVAPAAVLEALRGARLGADAAAGVELRFEPFILAVEAASLPDAAAFLQEGVQAGFRESGISCSASPPHRFVVTLRSASRLAAPLAADGRVLASEELVRALVAEANRQFEANERRVCELEARLRRRFGAAPQVADEKAAAAPPATRLFLGVPRLATKLAKECLQARGAFDEAAGVVSGEGSQLLLHLTPHAASQAREAAQRGALWEWLVASAQEEAPAAAAAAPGGDSKTRRRKAREAREALAQLEAARRVDETRVQLQLVEARSAPPPKAFAKPADALLATLREVLRRALGDDEAGWPPLAEVPRKWEVLGDVAVLPPGAFASPLWARVGAAALWAAVAGALGVRRVARYGAIGEGIVRESRTEMLTGGDGWVLHKENGIRYAFDITKSMFSSGNLTEKQRMAALSVPGEVVLDLYAGIGYFTLSILVHGRAALVHACEINPHSVEALRRSLALNGVAEGRCVLHAGDNRTLALSDAVDRVLLGLLPSSEDGWPIALRALRERSGGVLHVHGNVAPSSPARLAEWGEQCRARLAAAAAQLGRRWTARLRHVEHVKDFAPRVAHAVADIELRPAPDGGEAPAAGPAPRHALPARAPVRVVADASPQLFVRQLYPAREPMVLRGLDCGRVTAHLRATGAPLWTPEYLQRSGDAQRLVSMHVCPDEAMDFVQRNFCFKAVPLGEMVARASGDPRFRDSHFISPREKYYLRALGDNPRRDRADLGVQFPALAADFSLPPLFPRERFFSSVLRVSSEGTQLWPHYDICDNVLVQVTGRKRVVLWPPHDVNNLYVEGSSSPVVDVDDAAALARFPRLASAAPRECVLEPGDALFIPALWIHHVRPLAFSVAVNVFWQHLERDAYQAGDLYGNRDLRVADEALARVSEAAAALRQLPPYYHEFYLLKAQARLAARPAQPAPHAPDAPDAEE